MAQFLVQVEASGQAVVFHAFPVKQLVYPPIAWAQRQLASSVMEADLLVQLLPPVPVQVDQDSLG